MSTSIFKEITEKIIELLEKGSIPWRRPWKSNGPPRNLISKRQYRGINVFLLDLEGHASPYWLTPSQLERLQGEVRPGEKAAEAICWRWQQKVEKVWNSRTNTQESRVVWVPWCWHHSLYNTDQCTGIDRYLPGMRKRKFTPLELCEKIVAGMPNKPRVETGESRAFYRPLFDRVNMPNSSLFDSSEEYYSTLFHELVHSTGHISRLNRHRSMKSGFHHDAHDYSKEELVAEMGCAMLCALTGIEGVTLANSGAYIQAWLSRLQNDMKILFYASMEAQKAADFILGKAVSRARNEQLNDADDQSGA